MYQDVRLDQPPHLPQEHWSAIDGERVRLAQAIESGDDSAIIGGVKCLVESVARVTLDLAGEPCPVGMDYTQTVRKAHDVLLPQPGPGLATSSPFNRMSSGALKAVSDLGAVRNDYGNGHGRARPPLVEQEMAPLALDAGLLWVRWALRRIGPFVHGRPGPIIDELDKNEIFRSGELAARLDAANIPSLEPHHQRALGVAVGQRARRGTFVVRIDGVEPCADSDQLTPWTPDYRYGVATGLLEKADGTIQITSQALTLALEVISPLPDNRPWLESTIDRIVNETPPGAVDDDWSLASQVHNLVQTEVARRPQTERPHLQRLAEHIRPVPLF